MSFGRTENVFCGCLYLDGEVGDLSIVKMKKLMEQDH